jgi:hypothetical protein
VIRWFVRESTSINKILLKVFTLLICVVFWFVFDLCFVCVSISFVENASKKQSDHDDDGDDDEQAPRRSKRSGGGGGLYSFAVHRRLCR